MTSLIWGVHQLAIYLKCACAHVCVVCVYVYFLGSFDLMWSMLMSCYVCWNQSQSPLFLLGTRGNEWVESWSLCHLVQAGAIQGAQELGKWAIYYKHKVQCLPPKFFVYSLFLNISRLCSIVKILAFWYLHPYVTFVVKKERKIGKRKERRKEEIRKGLVSK